MVCLSVLGNKASCKAIKQQNKGAANGVYMLSSGNREFEVRFTNTIISSAFSVKLNNVRMKYHSLPTDVSYSFSLLTITLNFS